MVDERPTLTEGIEEYAFRAKEKLEAQDYAGAAAEGDRALDVLPNLAEISLTRGLALLRPVVNRVMTGDGSEHVCRQDFKGAYDAFRLALVMDPHNAEAQRELERLTELLKRIPDWAPQKFVDVVEQSDEQTSHAHAHAEHGAAAAEPDAGAGAEPHAMLDVIIIGAGAAGVGCGSMLQNVFGLDPSRVLLLERGEAVGETFRSWPEEMRFISPSFNQQGWTSSFDLNSVAYGTSPAFTLHTQHPSGAQFAAYLAELAEAAKLNVKLDTEVTRVETDGNVYNVHVRTGGGEQHEVTLHARYVVWAAGEFQYPRDAPGSLVGAELCQHNSSVRSWAKLPGDDYVIIGGYESGCDAAINLAKAGKQATVLASTASWNVQNPDPSTEISPYTNARLREVVAPDFSPRPKLLAPLRVLRVETAAEGGFNVVATWKAAESVTLTKLRQPLQSTEDDVPRAPLGSELVVHTSQPPVLCIGFQGTIASAAKDLFDFADDKAKGCLAGAPLLTKDDESTKAPGVFLVGPTVRHGELSFCFIYKFRQRFGVVANAICRGLGRDTTAAVENCRKMNMYLDDFTCCKSTCGESC